MLSLTDLQTESEKRIRKYFLSGSNEDRVDAEYASNMEILTPLFHQNFVSQQTEADDSPFALTHSSTESAKEKNSDALARESAQRATERELLNSRLHTLQQTNVALASTMARFSVAHAPEPPKLSSLEFKPIHVWLKKYKEYELLGGFRQMYEFVAKPQLLILIVKAGKDLTQVSAREKFTNIEIETLLRNHNVTLSLDQSVKRLKENVVFSIKGNAPALEEFSQFYEEFEDAVLSLGVQFKPENKVIKDIFISKIKPASFQDLVKNETATRGQFPTFTTVFVRAYNLLLDAKNTSATVGWYNQTIVPLVASKAKENVIQIDNKRKYSGPQPEKSKFIKSNPPVIGAGEKSKPEKQTYALPGDFTNPALKGTCFRCWEKHLKSEPCKAKVALPRPTSLPVTEVVVDSNKRNVPDAKDKRGIIEDMYLLIKWLMIFWSC